MQGMLQRLCLGLLSTTPLVESGWALKALTWQEVQNDAANQLNLAVGREVIQ